MVKFFEATLDKWPKLSRVLMGILILIGFMAYLYLDEVMSRTIGGIFFALIILGIGLFFFLIKRNSKSKR